MRETFEWEKNMMPFADDWYRAQGVKNIDRSVQCKKYDLIADGMKIEEKFLFSGREYQKVLIEMVQDMSDGSLGWFYHSEADRLAWFYCPSGHTERPMSVYIIQFKKLKEYVKKHLTKKQNEWVEFQVCNEHYGITLNLPILWNDLIDNGVAKYYSIR